MIEEQATVLQVEADKIIVQSQRQSACSTCSANKGCGTAVISKTVGQKRTQLTILRKANEHTDLRPGDQVLLGMNEDALLGNSVLAYVVPLLMFFIFAILTDWLAPLFGFEGEGYVVLASILGLISSVYFVKHYLQRHQGISIRPVILRKIQQVTAVRDNMQQP